MISSPKSQPMLSLVASLPNGDICEFSVPQKFTVDQVKKSLLNQTNPHFCPSDWFLVLNNEEVLDIEFRKIENAHRKIKESIQKQELVKVSLVSRHVLKRRSTANGAMRPDDLPDSRVKPTLIHHPSLVGVHNQEHDFHKPSFVNAFQKFEGPKSPRSLVEIPKENFKTSPRLITPETVNNNKESNKNNNKNNYTENKEKIQQQQQQQQSQSKENQNQNGTKRLQLVLPWNRNRKTATDPNLLPEKHRQRNTKIREILKKSFTQLPIRNDFPRFATRIFLCSGVTKEILHDPTEEKTADFETIERVIALLTILSKWLEGVDEVDIGGDVHLPSFLEQVGGDESPVVRILKACNQDAIAPAVIEVKMALGIKNMTKDVPNSWFFHILLPSPPPPPQHPYRQHYRSQQNENDNNNDNNNDESKNESEDYAIVHCEKREQDLKSQFNLKWELWLYFDKQIKECKEIYICVTDISFIDSIDHQRKIEILSSLKLYLHPDICSKYNFGPNEN